VAGGWVRDKVD